MVAVAMKLMGEPWQEGCTVVVAILMAGTALGVTVSTKVATLSQPFALIVVKV